MSSKNIRRSALFAAALTAFGMLINWIWFLIRGDLLLARTVYGGEWIGRVGFGLLMNRVYPMTMEGSGGGVSTWLEIAPGNLVLTFGVLLVVVVILQIICKRIRKNR